MSLSYLERVRPTYIENWPNDLWALSLAQVDIPLTIDQAVRLGGNIIEYGETFPDAGRPIDDIREQLDEAVSKFRDGAFVRLGSRSPKDSWLGARKGFRVTDGTQALKLLLDCSERISDDLHLACANDYCPHLFVRQWVHMPIWSEFRCFMKRRKLVGISQYQHIHKPFFPEIAKYESSILWSIQNFFETFRRVSHLDDVVFDVFVKITSRKDTGFAEERETEVKLIEINPFFEMTDPCLFSWRKGGDFDGTFRFVKEELPAREPTIDLTGACKESEIESRA